MGPCQAFGDHGSGGVPGQVPGTGGILSFSYQLMGLLPVMDEMYIDTGYIMEIPGYLMGDLFILFYVLFRNGIHEAPGKHF